MAKKNNIRINNVVVGTYGWHSSFNNWIPSCRPKGLAEQLVPYVNNDYLKTDFESLRKVAKIIDDYDYSLLIDEDGTIVFYNLDY